MAKRKFLLDPNETAMQNVWRCAHATTAFVMQKWWRGLRLTEEERHDIFQDIMARSVVMFVCKVLEHRYDRRFDFWQNMFSCSWGCASNVVQKSLVTIRKKLSERSIDTPMGDDDETYMDTLADMGTTPLNYMRDCDYRKPRKSSDEYLKDLDTAVGDRKREGIRRRYREALAREKEEKDERDHEIRVALGLEEG